MNEMFQIAKGFQTSINIAYDLYNDDKIHAFIPTQSSLDIIEDVLLSTAASSTQRSRILIGAYGRGKSHIILVLLSMLFKKDKTMFDALLKKMKKSNPPLYEYALDYLNSNQRILPIIVRGSSTSLTQSFLSALHQALNEENLSDLMPETHFMAAIKQISNWKSNYTTTYDKFIKLISKTPMDFILALEEFDVNAYEEFIRLYPSLTSGSTFNPLLGFDVVELFQNITKKLKDIGYNGIYVIYDEFSKYLESSIATATNSDIKLLQDFAEKCDRSGKMQMHLMLISHKDISNYIDINLSKDKVDGWRGVSGRFKHMQLHNNYSQIYEIIAAVVRKEKNTWEKFKKQNQDRFDDLKDRYTKNGLLNQNDQEEVINAVEGCYPLHPISTFILPRISEKVAQNERTLFTFLSSDDNFTLSDFLKKENVEFSLLTPDFIYDYFEPLFRKEPYTSEIYRLYKLTDSVLRKVEGKFLHTKIIKTLAIIYLVEQFEKLPPIVDIIVETYREYVDDSKEIHEVLNELVDKDCIVYLKRSNQYLKIKETSGENIQEEIENYIHLRLSNTSVVDILNTSAFDSFMYPTAYNDDNDITRYFDFTFIDSEDYWQTDNWYERISKSNSDGVIFAIVPDNQNEIEDLQIDILKKTGFLDRIAFAIPKKYSDIQKDALDFAAVTALKASAGEDVILSDEYDIYIEDLSEVITSFYNDFARPESGNAYYFYHGEQYMFRRKSQLTGLLSKICETTFYRTPIINNESINKNELPTVAINSRSKIISGLLSNKLTPNLGLSGNGQDVSIMRSTLIQTGVLNNIDTNPEIDLAPHDNKIRDMLTEIKIFFGKKAIVHGGANFKLLYDILTMPCHGFGMKRGVIPIYIAVVLHSFKTNIVFLYNDNEVKITPDLLNNINESPENYSVILEDWNEEKAQYMEQLEKLFSKYVKEFEKAYNSFTYITLAMNQWYLTLPKYAKDMSSIYDENGKKQMIDTSKRKFINNLKQVEINPREFLLEKIFSVYGMNEFNASIIDNIAATKCLYDNAIKNLNYTLKFKIKELFSDSVRFGSMTSIVKDWYESLSEYTLQTLFSGNENKILGIIMNITNDEDAFIQRLAKAITFLRLEDWNDNTVDVFMRDLRTFKKTIEEFDSRKELEVKDTASYEIVFTDANGKKIPKRFDKIVYSDRAKLLFNEILTHLDEYGQSINEQEKRQVLIELLEKLC